ncbi:MAG: OsmC family protein [Desulfovibrionaceae bacterium]|jgi:ribosomal protein S12 methylthiotransferase accessory factor|nr:OsmC family protein [Desulfovibrionaceae bacterium]
MNEPIDVSISYPGGKRIDATIAGYTVTTDHPVKDGGEGTAPNPFQLFWVALANCMGHYARSFCEERKIPIEGMGLTVHCEFDEAVKRYTRVTTTLTLPGGFPEKYRTAIQRAVEACTVKKHILNAPDFELVIAD